MILLQRPINPPRSGAILQPSLPGERCVVDVCGQPLNIVAVLYLVHYELAVPLGMLAGNLVHASWKLTAWVPFNRKLAVLFLDRSCDERLLNDQQRQSESDEGGRVNDDSPNIFNFSRINYQLVEINA